MLLDTSQMNSFFGGIFLRYPVLVLSWSQCSPALIMSWSQLVCLDYNTTPTQCCCLTFCLHLPCTLGVVKPALG